ncbi:alpha/beta fold hydrolase [Streptomyces sp. NBC_00513]|uniref:alpha/beta fold hydrolase n=1 Tax=unclassified Streptomyces TaxID=2593676 RepID=UPI00225829CE|nr:alpha/beta hydrolase [Streptomyces sp. NBC_00424]MCX5073522.1 alpha/beta fold hydrolase [Streptomyces sp. NBC_00424]WUD43230.1 alpha/beta fold hydrolase [Streptomyces sp. NBC_00513]
MSKPPRLTLPPAARAYRLTTSRGAFAVHEAGEPLRGTALLVPGYTGSKEDFIGLLEPLADAGFRVVAVDGRGQHESPGPREESAYALEELAGDVLAQAAAVSGVDGGPIHLVGHSLGGLIARAAVLRDHTPFASLTLMSSGPAAISEAQQERTKLLVAALESLRGVPPVECMSVVWAAMRAQDPVDAPVDGPELTEFLRGRWLATEPEQLIAAGRVLMSEPDRVAELAAVPLRMLVLSGVVDDAWPVPLMDSMAERLGASRVIVKGAEHSPNAENPQVTADALADFWSAAAPE